MRNLLLTSAAFLATTAPVAMAHAPGTDGGTADRGCAPVAGGSIYVGASDVSCSIAREVVRGYRRGVSYSRWYCRGSSRSFGHCHGMGIRKGGTVHWAVND